MNWRLSTDYVERIDGHTLFLNDTDCIKIPRYSSRRSMHKVPMASSPSNIPLHAWSSLSMLKEEHLLIVL